MEVAIMKKLLVVMFVVILSACHLNEGGSIMQKHVEMLYPVVRIDAGALGSGVVILSQENYSLILTAKHVVGLKRKVKIVFYPDEVEYDGKVIKRSKDHDLALIRVEHYHPYVAKFALNLCPPVFTKVYKVGGGLGLEPFPGEGIVTGIDDYVMTVSSLIIFGDSGGALFVKEDGHYRLTGTLVAVASSKGGPVYHIGVVHNMNSILEFLNAK
jgi:S1-C subfamily serine protease